MKIILHITPGPTFRPHSPLFQSEYKELSKNFFGYIFTTAPKGGSYNFFRFKLFAVGSRYKIRDVIKFFGFCLWKAIVLLFKGERIQIVTTYDPLKTGLIGLIIARIHRAKFAPQVNGVYTSPAEWLDETDCIRNKLKKKLYPLVMGFVLKRADGIRLLYKEQVDFFGDSLQNKVIQDFHCFVPTDQFVNIREDKEILFAGYPFKRKGVDVLIEAFKSIAPKFPDWKLKILGWYPNTEELYNAIGGHPQIYHHPPVYHEQMIQHIGSCAILVLPSRSEAMGRVLVEAMAAEKPRIGSNIDGIPYVINDGVDGLLVEPGNIMDLAQKLKRLMGDPGLRRKLGLAGKKRLSKEFSQEVYLKNVLRFYNNVLKS